jgi:hypothetical protein
MAVRDFVDADGVSWRVWPVTPAAIRPRTAIEDYLGEYGEGWLCFESASERRRLADYPPGWETLSEEALRSLLKAAAVVATRRSRHLPPPLEPPDR